MNIDALIKLGAALEDLLEHDGWKYISDYMERRKNTAMRSLQATRFNTLEEVVRLQAEIKTYDAIIGEIEHVIRIAKEKRKAMEQ